MSITTYAGNFDEHAAAELMADLQVLVERGVVEEIRIPNRPSRYAVAPPAAPAYAMGETPPLVADWPEPCPSCGATADFDGGGRCNGCHVAWPSHM